MNTLKVEILGTGCPKCKKLAEHAEKAILELGIAAEVVKIEDMTEIAERGVMLTPTLAIDGDPKIVGKVATISSIKQILEEYR